MLKALVTGGAGFIGSHIVDYLIKKGKPVKIVDNLSSGNLNNLSKWKKNELYEFIKADLLDEENIYEAVKGCDEVYHLAANPEVNVKKASPEDHFKQNIEATYNLLEAMRLDGNQRFIIFTSTSTIYGEAEQIPTKESYGPLKPISMYGASKLACEALISAYASMFGFRGLIYRLANVVGPRTNHGVIYDFVKKLHENPNELEVLGDGSQSKSYLYIDDCISGIMCGIKSNDAVEIYNIGSEDRTNVLAIAEIVTNEMGFNNAVLKLTGGVDGGRGWKGDVKLMQLNMNNLKRLGWMPRYSSDEAVKLTVRSIINSF